MSKVSGYCSICIWKVHIWHMSICALCMTLKNSVLLNTGYFSSIVPAIAQLAAMPHGFMPWRQPSWKFPNLAHGPLTRMQHGSSSILEFASHQNFKLQILTDVAKYPPQSNFSASTGFLDHSLTPSRDKQPIGLDLI